MNRNELKAEQNHLLCSGLRTCTNNTLDIDYVLVQSSSGRYNVNDAPGVRC